MSERAVRDAPQRRCEWCGCQMPPGASPRAKYHKPSCRTQASRQRRGMKLLRDLADLILRTMPKPPSVNCPDCGRDMTFDDLWSS